VVGPTAGYIGVMGIRNATPQQNCNLPSNLNVQLDSNLQQVKSESTSITCNSKILLGDISYSFNGSDLNGNFGCKLVNKNNKITVVGCDFSKSPVMNYYLNKGNIDDLSGSSSIGIVNAQNNNSLTINFTVNGGPPSSINVYTIDNTYVQCGGSVNCPIQNELNVTYNLPPSGISVPLLDIIKSGKSRQLQISGGNNNNGNIILNLTDNSDKMGIDVDGDYAFSITDGKNPKLSLSPCTITVSHNNCNGGTTVVPAPSNNNTAPAPYSPPQQFKGLAFYQQFNIGSLQNVLFSLEPTNSPNLGYGYVLLTPSTNFVVYLPNNQNIQIGITPLDSQSNPTKWVACGSKDLNCWKSFNNNIISIPAGDLFQATNGKTYDLTQSFDIYFKSSSNIWHENDITNPQNLEPYSSSSNYWSGLEISPNYLANTPPGSTSSIYSACDTPTQNPIGNIWVFKVTSTDVPSISYNGNSFRIKSFDIVSDLTNNYNIKSSDNVYGYLCVDDTSYNKDTFQFSYGNTLGSSVGDDLLISISNDIYEGFTLLKGMSGSSFNLWISKGYIGLRYYCTKWPGANDNCISNAQTLRAS
jgi:hypothetical protein